jgi:SAM-dependent methyltransferase
MSWIHGFIEEVQFAFTAIARILGAAASALLILSALSTLYHFPRDTDRDTAADAAKTPAAFYESSYGLDPAQRKGLDYETTARRAAEAFGIEGIIRESVTKYRLDKAKVLEVGSGRGYLQDIVEDYTGLDISAAVARFYHKRFVAGSAFAMPFEPDTFDAVWSVWVVEHLDHPELAFNEMRRVLKPGGIIILLPAWNCEPWLSGGYAVRPYADFTLPGKLVKASIGLRQSGWFQLLHRTPARLIRWGSYAWSGRTTRLRFVELQPNYEVYWQADSDAAISLDSYEAYLWFQSRGDKCLNCGSARAELTEMRWPLIIRVNK